MTSRFTFRVLPRIGSAWLFCAAALTGCVVVPNQLHDHQGLIVGQVSGELVGEVHTGDLRVGNKSHSGSIRDGFLVLPVVPGEHQIDGFQLRGVSTTSGSFYLRTDSLLRLPNKKVTVGPGEVVNIGLIALIPERPRSPRYHVIYIDNTEAVAEWLKRDHPRLYESFEGAPIPLADEDYADGERLKVVRRHIARLLWHTDQRPAGYIGGPVGTVAYSASGSWRDLQPLELASTEDLSQCSSALGRFACLLEDGALLYGEKGNLRELEGPAGVSLHGAFIGPQGSLLAVDKRWGIYRWLDEERWQKTSEGLLERDFDAPVRLRLTVSGDRGYLYNVGYSRQSGRVLAIDAQGHAEELPMIKPKPTRSRWGVAVPGGILIGPHQATWGPRAIFVSDSGEVEQRSAPSMSCKLAIPRSEAVDLICGDSAEQRWSSTDGGVSWERRH